MHLFLSLLILIHIFLPCSMTTPNGRFMTQKKICLSMSDCKFFRLLVEENHFFSLTTDFMFDLTFLFAVHPESWNPMWSVSR